MKNLGRIALVIAMHSYLAYANDNLSVNSVIAQLLTGQVPLLQPGDLLLNKERGYGLGTYTSYRDGWGVGRHIYGSNYFHYVRDPWNGLVEFFWDIDFIPANAKWEAENAERGCGENSALKTRGDAIVQDFPGRTRGVAKVVRQIVEKFLYAGRRF